MKRIGLKDDLTAVSSNDFTESTVGEDILRSSSASREDFTESMVGEDSNVDATPGTDEKLASRSLDRNVAAGQAREGTKRHCGKRK